MERREQARRSHDFMTADSLREELRGRGISIDDRTKMWNAEDGRKGMIGAAAPVTDGIAEAELNKLLEEREAARRVKDYGEADRVRRALAAALSSRPVRMALFRVLIGLPGLQIRDELKQKGVTLDDRTRVWQSIDGRRGMIGGGAMAGGMGGNSMVRKPLSSSGNTFCCSWLTSINVCFARCFASRARRVCSRFPRPGSIRSRSGSVLALWLCLGRCVGPARCQGVFRAPPAAFRPRHAKLGRD